MEGPRALKENEFQHLVQFLDKNLRSEYDWSIANEYPTAFCASNMPNIRIITDEKAEVLSHAVWRPLLVKTPIGIFKVAAIGSVVTASHHRNQGLSRRVMDDCLQQAREQGCDFAILWTSIYDFYRKMGFELAGTEVSFEIKEDLKVPSTGLKFLDSSKVSPEAILRLFSQHSVSTFRTLDEVRRYLNIPNSRVYTAWDDSGALAAYAVEGKGIDLTAHIHEWGGKVSALLALLQHIRQSQGRSITVITPFHAENLIRKLTGLGVQPQLGYLGMIKLLNPNQIFSKLQRQARLEFGIENLIFEKRDENYIFGLKNQIFKTDSEADVVRLLFGPQAPTEIHAFEGEVKDALEKLLPTKMWLWGWDSI